MIKNIIFDFGNVLLNLDIPKTIEGFDNLLSPYAEKEIYTPAVYNLVEKLEVAEINPESFLWGIQKLANGNVEPNIIQDIWNSMLLDLPDERLDFLLELRKKYRVHLLSNTNAIHLAYIRKYLKKEKEITDFDTRFFDKAYYSHLIKLRKPGIETFQFVLKDANLVAEETIFIDDVEENLMAPVKLGMQTYHHNPSDNIIEKLNHILSKSI